MNGWQRNARQTFDVENSAAHNLKLLALQYLRRFYRDFPRSGGIETVVDMRGDGGIIADGWLTFPLPDGTWFVATVETTTAEMGKELRYVPPFRKISGDAFAISSLIVATAFWWYYLSDPMLFFAQAQVKMAGWLFGAILTGILLYLLLFHQSRRYRYIYAIEQFKQYQANQQWIAMTDDVFPDPEDKYLIELKNQCMRNGIGLIQIREPDQVSLLISPAALPVTPKKRRTIRWVSLQDLAEKASFSRWSGSIPGHKLSAYLMEGTNALLMRFGNNIHVQLVVGLCAISSLLGIFAFENLKSPVNKVNEKAYVRQLQATLHKFRPESTAMDSVVTSWVLPVYADMLPYLDARADDIPSWSVPGFLLEQPNKEWLSQANNDFPYYNCNQFARQTEVRYLLQLDQYFPLDFALKQAQRLNAVNIKVNCYWLGCFSERTSDFFLVSAQSYTSRKNAEKAQRQLQQSLKAKKLGMYVNILEIIPYKNQ